MASNNTKPTRIDNEFRNDLLKISRIRLEKNLAKFTPKDLGMAEMTRLFRRTENYPKCLEELKTKPKRENILNNKKKTY